MKNKLGLTLAIIGTAILVAAPFALEKYRPKSSANFTTKPSTTLNYPDLVAPDFIQTTNELSVDFNNYKSLSGSVTYLSYAKNFSNELESENSYLTLNEAQKEEMLNYLLSTYNGNINLKDFESRQLIDGASPKQYGGWWTTIGAATDRIKVEFISTTNGSYRGIRYFEQVGQDLGFAPLYKAVLINPAENRIAIITLDISQLITFKQFTSPTSDEPLSNQLSAYAVLENYKNSALLNELVLYLDALVKESLVK